MVTFGYLQMCIVPANCITVASVFYNLDDTGSSQFETISVTFMSSANSMVFVL